MVGQKLSQIQLGIAPAFQCGYWLEENSGFGLLIISIYPRLFFDAHTFLFLNYPCYITTHVSPTKEYPYVANRSNSFQLLHNFNSYDIRTFHHPIPMIIVFLYGFPPIHSKSPPLNRRLYLIIHFPTKHLHLHPNTLEKKFGE